MSSKTHLRSDSKKAHTHAVYVLPVFEAVKLANVKRFLLISAVDTRDRSGPLPAYYDEEDIKVSDKMWGKLASTLLCSDSYISNQPYFLFPTLDSIGTYMQAKTDADKFLITQTDIPYIILRPGALLDDSSVGKVQLAIADAEQKKGLHLSGGVTREDVAATALALLEEKRIDKKVVDVMGGREGEVGQEGASVAERVKHLVEQL